MSEGPQLWTSKELPQALHDSKQSLSFMIYIRMLFDLPLSWTSCMGNSICSVETNLSFGMETHILNLRMLGGMKKFPDYTQWEEL